jgi:hypothetical protein
MAQNTSAAVVSNIFTAPQAAFAAIKERPSPWLPLLVLIAGTFAVQFYYLQSVDIAWLIDTQLQAAGTLTDEQRRQAVDGTLRIPLSVLGVLQGFSSAILILVVYALGALYYTAISFATHDGVKFGQWFSLIAWCSLPGALGLLAALVNLAASDVRFMPQEHVNPLSFASLLAIDPQGATGVQRLLLAFDVTFLWAMVLQILGYQAFTQRSLVKSTVIVLGPLALIVLIGSLAALT